MPEVPDFMPETLGEGDPYEKCNELIAKMVDLTGPYFEQLTKAELTFAVETLRRWVWKILEMEDEASGP